MLVEAREALEGRLDVLGGYVTYLLCLENAHEPPVAIAIVHEKKAVAFDDVGLALDSRCEAVQGIYKIKVDGLVWNGE